MCPLLSLELTRIVSRVKPTANDEVMYLQNKGGENELIWWKIECWTFFVRLIETYQLSWGIAYVLQKARAHSSSTHVKLRRCRCSWHPFLQSRGNPPPTCLYIDDENRLKGHLGTVVRREAIIYEWSTVLPRKILFTLATFSRAYFFVTFPAALIYTSRRP